MKFKQQPIPFLFRIGLLECQFRWKLSCCRHLHKEKSKEEYKNIMHFVDLHTTQLNVKTFNVFTEFHDFWKMGWLQNSYERGNPAVNTLRLVWIWTLIWSRSEFSPDSFQNKLPSGSNPNGKLNNDGPPLFSTFSFSLSVCFSFFPAPHTVSISCSHCHLVAS